MFRRILFIVLILNGFLLQAQVNRSIDGFGNNKQTPEWGSAGSIMPSLASNGFADGISAMGGEFRPNARVISNQVFDQKESIADSRNLSEFVWAFGQFIDHDISHVLNNQSEYYPITVPSNDEYFVPGSHIPFVRSHYSPGSGITIDFPRKYNNEITSFIDASNVYGSNEIHASWLRSYVKGKLKMSAGNYLPWNTLDQEFNGLSDPGAPKMDDDLGSNFRLYVAGDVRANEHPILITLHTLFAREHNRICDSLSNEYPSWNDELLYQKARKIIGAYIQKITFEDWLPTIGVHLPDYQGYDMTVNPGILNEFSAAAFRLGHTLITNNVVRLTYEGDTIKQGNIDIKDAFFNPTLITLAGGIEPYILGVLSRNQQLNDAKIVDGLRNFLFGHPGSGGLDLASINIMRGRERGLPDYNQLRRDFGLAAYSDFDQITDDIFLIENLRFLYGNIDNIDPWVAMLAENHLENMMFGELLHKIISIQFLRLRDGDRYFYQNDEFLSEKEKEEISRISLKKIIERNSTLDMLPDNVFIVSEREINIEEGPELLNVQLDAILYPNPSDGMVNIKFIMLKDATEVHLRIMDPLGKVYENRGISASEGVNFLALDLSAYSPGIYFILLENGQHFKLLKLSIDR